MANEKNVKATERNVVTEQTVKGPAESGFPKPLNNGGKHLIVGRRAFKTKDGREMWGYAIYGQFQGKETKVDLAAYDQGGFEVLDMIFSLRPVVELEMHDETMRDSDTGEVRTYTVYTVSATDDDGDILTCRVKPARDSDKSVLGYFVQKLNRRIKAEEAEAEAEAAKAAGETDKTDRAG